jgi:hypothetical protein
LKLSYTIRREKEGGVRLREKEARRRSFGNDGFVAVVG